MSIDKRQKVRSKENRRKCRERGICETCGGMSGPFECHHIRSKGQGGDDAMDNLSCQCGGPSGCHTKITQGKIKFKRNPDLVPPDNMTTVIDAFCDEFNNEGEGS